MPLYLGQDDAGTSSYSLQDFEPSWGTKMNAAVRESWLEGLSSPLATWAQTSFDTGRAGEATYDSMGNVVSRESKSDDLKLSAADAANEIKQSGVKYNKTVGDGQYTKTQLAILLERQRELTAIKDVRERTPWDMSSPIRGVGMFGAGMVDPINLATAFVPWTRPLVPAIRAISIARAGLMSESLATRTMSRAVLGGADAGISTAVMEPAYYGIRNQIGDDYGALDSMANIAFGTAFGGGLHVLGGAAGDAFKMRKGGMVTPNPVAEPIAPPPGTVPGGETRIRIGETYEPARWSVIDADQLTATVDKADNQFRDRTRAAYQTEIQQRANNIDFNLLADSPVMDYGAPTLAADGRIIGGNGRALFISRAYEIGKGNDYRAGLEARMVEMGIDPDAVRGMSKPVLVRVLQREVDVKRAAMLSNEGGSTDMSPLEQAKVDAERLGDARLQVSADGALDAPENRAAIRRWVEAQPENKRNGLVDEDGKLSATGIQRLNGALLFQAYGDSPVLGRLIESMDPGSRNLAAALGRTAPVLANARGAIATGDLHPLDIAGDIQLAVEKFNALRESGMKVADYLAQLDAFETGMTPESLALLDFMGRNISSPRRMADAITGFYDRLTEAGNPKQADMFGAGAVPDKAAMLDASIRAAEQGVDTAAEVAVGLAPETREATLRASVAQSVDGRMVDVDAIVGMDESLNTASRADALAAADRNFQPEAVALADFDASAEVQARVDAAPNWEAVKDAETALADADAMLADTVKSGDAAFRYSRGEAPGQKKATLWQGSTARFGAEEGAPLGRFRWDFINSEGGEQAQAFGYGHYLAQQAWISQTMYRERLVKMRGGALSSFSIPDGAGGVMSISRNDDPAWQLADGTIVHISQKDAKLSGVAAAIAQIDRYGYAEARDTFESLLPDARKEVERINRGFQAAKVDGKWNVLTPDGKPEYRDGFDTEAEAVEAVADYNKGFYRRVDRDAANARLAELEETLAALDEVTVEVPNSKTEVARSKDGWTVQWAGTNETGFKVFDSEDAARSFVPRDLAPGIQKYTPPLPENMRTRVMAGDQEVALSDVALGWLQSEVTRNQLDYLPEFTQTIGLDLVEKPNTQAGANAKISVNALVDKLIKEGAGPSVLDPFYALKEQGVESITLERPGSLYRAEMSGVDFQNLMLWNEPLSAQPEKVRKAFERFGVSEKKDVKWVEATSDDWYTQNDIMRIQRNGVGRFVLFNDGRIVDAYATLAEAKEAASTASSKTGERAYKDLIDLIKGDDANDALLDAIMSAHNEIALRRFSGYPDPVEAMGDSGYMPRSDEVASVILNQAGVPGHAFLDGNSRGATDTPGYNLVIYGDDVAKIVDRYARQTGEIGRATDTAEGLTEAIRLSFGKSTEALLDAGRIKVVGTVDEIPGGPHPRDVHGATDRLGNVYIVAENATEADIKGLILHEVGVHAGMEKMLGPKLFDEILTELDDALLRGEEWAIRAKSYVPEKTPADMVREEQLAYLVQSAPDLPISKRIIAAVRAWFYRTFEFARERMTLTEGDFQALAVSALRYSGRWADLHADMMTHYARAGNMEDYSMGVRAGDQTQPGEDAMRYSRGDVPDPSTAKDELKPYDDAVKRAKGYASVLRAAADKLENDAQATEAMRAAMPDITPTEITDLLDQLRRQVKGLRGVARTARTMMGAEDVAAGLQADAMKAADTLANNLEMAAVIEKRNAALNMNARLKAASYINQFREAKLDFEGFRGLLVGTERKRAGGRISVEAEQKNFRGEWLGGMIADLEKGDLMRQFTSGDFDRDVSVALHNMGKGLDNSKLSPEAVKIAEIVNKYQTDARNTRNRFGAWIRDLNGYITRQTHDMFKIRDAGEKAFKEFVLPRLDLERSLRDFDGTADDFLTRVYDDFAAGSHMKVVAGEDDLQALGRGSSLARRESVSRVLYFKDGNASFEYNEKFGQGRLAETVLGGLEQSAKSAGLMKLLGTNPEATVTRLFDEYAESLRGDPARRAKFLEYRGELENLLSHVDGRANIPGNVTAAKISSFVRSWVSMTKLGGALISSVTDLSNYAAELRFGQDKNLFSGTLEGIGAVTQGRATGEKKQVLSSLGVFHESTLGAVFARFDSPELMGGKTAAAMQTFFKLTGLNWWTESLRDGYALTHSHYLATNAGQSFDKLPEALRDMLGLYNIDAGKWDVLRIATMQQADGRAYMTPEGLKTVPRAALENYITSIGRTVSDASVANLQDDLASALRTMTIDRMHHAVIEPGARTRAFMLRGTKPGTVPGELLRFATQFKSFPVALIQSTLGREVYGRGYDTLGDYLKNGKGDMVGMATFLALSMSMGYAAMSIKDLLKGRNPRPVDDPRTWAAAFIQGGGLGIYGDFLFGKYNRMGGTLSGSLIGPAANIVDTVADLWTRIRTGDDVAGTAFKALIDNTPFLNLFYTRAALDYLVLYKVQEALNPGFLRRMEKRIERENGQTFYLPPTAAL